MNFLKFTGIALAAVACGAGFVSCSDDDDDNNVPGGGNNPGVVVNPSNVFTAGLPSKVGALNIIKGADGRVVSMNDSEDGIRITFAYPGIGRADSYDVVMQVEDDEDRHVFNLLLNDAGFTKYCRQIESDGDIEEWWFEYNSDSRLTKMKRTEGGNEVTDITYTDGNVTAVKVRSEEDNCGGDYKIGYGSSAIENKGCIMLFDDTFGIDMDEMEYAYFAGLLGKATRQLPVSNDYVRFDPEEDTYSWNKTFSWTLNARNMPIKLTTVSTDEWGSEEETFDFAW